GLGDSLEYLLRPRHRLVCGKALRRDLHHLHRDTPVLRQAVGQLQEEEFPRVEKCLENPVSRPRIEKKKKKKKKPTQRKKKKKKKTERSEKDGARLRDLLSERLRGTSSRLPSPSRS